MKKGLIVVENSFLSAIVLFVLTIVYCFAPLMILADKLLNVIVIWVIACAYWCFSKDIKLFLTWNYLELFFTIWFFLCTLVNGITILDIKSGIYIFVNLVCLSMIYAYDYSSRQRQLSILSIVTVIMGVLICVSSLVLYFLAYSKVVYHKSVTGMRLVIGQNYDGRLYGVLCNANWLGFFCVIVIGMALLRMIKRENKGVFELIAVVLAYITLLLTNSRGSMIGMLVLIGGITFGYYMKKDNTTTGKLIKSLAKTLGIVILTFAISYPVKLACGEIYATVNPDGIRRGSVKEIMELMTRDQKSLTSNSHLRLTMWQAGGEIICENPVFGVGHSHVEDEVRKQINDNTFPNITSNTHNLYIQVGVTTGIIGLFLFMCVLLRIMIKMFVSIYIKKETGVNEICVFSIVIAIMFISLVENDILFSRNFMATIFWILFGYLKYSLLLSKKQVNLGGKAS